MVLRRTRSQGLGGNAEEGSVLGCLENSLRFFGYRRHLLALGEMAEFVIDALVVSGHIGLHSGGRRFFETVRLSESTDFGLSKELGAFSVASRGDSFGKLAFYLLKRPILNIPVEPDARTLHSPHVRQELPRKNPLRAVLDAKFVLRVVFDRREALALLEVVEQAGQVVVLRAWLDVVELVRQVLVVVAAPFRDCDVASRLLEQYRWTNRAVARHLTTTITTTLQNILFRTHRTLGAAPIAMLLNMRSVNYLYRGIVRDCLIFSGFQGVRRQELLFRNAGAILPVAAIADVVYLFHYGHFGAVGLQLVGVPGVEAELVVRQSLHLVC